MSEADECPECGMPVRRGRVTSLDFETGEEYDSGGYVHWTCAGLMGKGPGSTACNEIKGLRERIAERDKLIDELAAALRELRKRHYCATSGAIQSPSSIGFDALSRVERVVRKDKE